METNAVFASLNADVFIIRQARTLDIQTDLGNLLVLQNQIAMIPRGLRYRITISEDRVRLVVTRASYTRVIPPSRAWGQ